MPQVISTNVPSLNAQRNLDGSQNDLNVSLQRLSSGLRINSARDDAAGLAISERFTAQIRGLNQAVRNANDGISLAQTAEGDLQQVTNNLQRIRELAVQSANATNSSSDRQAIQAEVDQLSAEVNRIAEQSNFNGVNLLDGTFTSQVFQVGANAGQTITVDNIVDARSSSLGRNALELSGTALNTEAATNAVGAETDLTITTADGGASEVISYAAGASAADIATAINNGAASVGISATASNSVTLSGLSGLGAGTGEVSFTLEGQSITALPTSTNDLSAVLDAINGVQNLTGVTATFSSDTARDSITLTNSDGADIDIAAFAVNGASNESISFGALTLTEGGTVAGASTGTVQLESSQGAITTTNANADVFSATSGTFSSVAGIDVSTASGASDALAVIDSALSQVNGGRADLGAIQNRFESVVGSLQTSAENLSAARSRIRDADFAAETANLARAQVLQQAGISVLTQANAQSQNVLALLQ
ncbi:MAG: flagellin [Pseudomonadota bacterium]